MSETQLKAKESVLSVDFLEKLEGKTLPLTLRRQYKLIDSEALSKLLLSPRAHVKNGSYMTCKTCYRNILNKKLDKPPKFAISNNWCIGQLPNNLIDGEIEDILAASIAKVRIFLMFIPILQVHTKQSKVIMCFS